ncbi:MAG: hypothetical protein ABJA81_06555, partial [Nocardioidaceae bacterium]
LGGAGRDRAAQDDRVMRARGTVRDVTGDRAVQLEIIEVEAHQIEASRTSGDAESETVEGGER